MTIPGIGLVTAVALAALAPPAETFRRGRDFAAWGAYAFAAFDRRQAEAGRRLLIIDANSILLRVARHGAPAGSWITRMLARKPPMLVRVALANKMARVVWALLTSGEVYRAPAAVV